MPVTELYILYSLNYVNLHNYGTTAFHLTTLMDLS